jgi:hypothetical protein
MSAALKLQRVSVEEYLAGELISPVKHEYLGGVVYAMAGGRNAHNLIASTEQGFVTETYADRDAVIPLPEIGIELPLAEVYDGVQFAPEPDDEAG